MRPVVASARILWGTGLALSVAACSGDDGACPSVMTYADTIVTVSAVRDDTGQSVDRVSLTSVEQEGRPLVEELKSIVRETRPIEPGQGSSNAGRFFGLTIGARDQLVCTVPCGFGTYPGEFELVVVSDDGGRARSVVGADYHASGSGCGGAVEDGTDLVLVLDPPR